MFHNPKERSLFPEFVSADLWSTARGYFFEGRVLEDQNVSIDVEG